MHVSLQGSTSSSSTSGSKKIGGFSLRDEEPVPSAGSMLFKKSTSKEEPLSSKTPKLSVAAHAKAASLSALKKKEKTEEEEDRKREPKSKVTQSKPSPPQRKAIPSSSGVKRPSDPSPASSSGHAKRKKKGLCYMSAIFPCHVQIYFSILSVQGKRARSLVVSCQK